MCVGVDRNKMSVKMVDAPKIRNESKFQVFMANTVIQADLIYMPEDDGYNFILDVVDVGSRACDAQPLEGRTAKDVIEGFECIFKRDYIKPPFRYLYTDPGSEFNNEEFHEHMKDYKIIVRHTMTNRKNQMGVVEYYNHILTKVLGTKMTAHEIEHDEPNSDWVESLPKIIDELNIARATLGGHQLRFEKKSKMKLPILCRGATGCVETSAPKTAHQGVEGLVQNVRK